MAVNGGGGAPHNPRGWAGFVKAECEHYPGLVPAGGNGKEESEASVCLAYQLRREIVFGFNCKLPPENSRTLLIYS